MKGDLLDDEIDGKETERSALAPEAVDKNGAVLLPGLFDKTKNGVDDILVDNILNAVLGPVKGEEAHPFDCGIVLGVSACAVDNMGNLVEAEPLDVLSRWSNTCAIMSSPMKMQSVILTGMEIY